MTSKHRIKAIETRYAGHLFRSRLEARWAAWLDMFGVKWTYEPFDAAGYIPDFICQSGVGAFIVEIKGLPCSDPRLLDELDSAVARLRAAGHSFTHVIALGCDPDFRSTETIHIAETGGTTEIQTGVIGVSMAWGHIGPAHTFDIPSCTAAGSEPWEVQEAWGRAHEISRWMPVASPQSDAISDAAVLVERMRRKGVAFEVLPDGRLALEYPQGAVSDGEREEIRARKADVITVLCGVPR